MSFKPDIHLFTDGSCYPNPGPGGWAYILRHLPTNLSKEDSGYSADTTNNRMEMLAVIQGIYRLKKPCKVHIFSDSEYVCKGINKWRIGWRKKRFSTIKNPDMWEQLDNLLNKHEVKAVWVPGHTGHKENERCDYLAGLARKSGHKNKYEYEMM